MTKQTDPRKDVVLSLLRVASSVERRLDRKLASTRGISFSEYQLVRQLADAPAGASARVDLAHAVGLTPSAVTRALKPLEKMGYVTTTRDERDARRAMAELTPAGRELLDDAEGAVDDDVSSIDLGPDQLSRLASLLDQLGRPR